MKTLRHIPLLASLLALSLSNGSAADPAPADAKRISDRYALTHKRIETLLGPRNNPVALPANPPNPFYAAPKEALVTSPSGQDPVESGLVPEGADISDIDTIRKYAPTLRVGGVINRGGTLFITVNNTPCKIGDVIPVGPRDRPIYLKLLGLSMSEFTLGLNDAALAVPLLKK